MKANKEAKKEYNKLNAMYYATLHTQKKNWELMNIIKKKPNM